MTISGFSPHPTGMDTRSADPLLEAILEQVRLGRTVEFDDDIGPDLGVRLRKQVVNLNVPRDKAIRKLTVVHWINDSDYLERMRRRNSASAIAEFIRSLGHEMGVEIAAQEREGWLA